MWQTVNDLPERVRADAIALLNQQLADRPARKAARSDAQVSGAPVGKARRSFRKGR
jgi:hypothetical protein